MIFGIDVGGTYTDAVAMNGAKVIHWFKTPTTKNMLRCLGEAMERLERIEPVSRWERLVISTTMLTNIVAQQRYENVGLMVIPGPGINPDILDYPTETAVLSGAINYRGIEIASLNEKEVKDKAQFFYQKGYRHLALVGKFSGRNGKHEEQAADWVKEIYPDMEITLGHRISSYLNYPRRIITTWLTAATKKAYREFIIGVENVLTKYGISCPVYIMKADGGVIPINEVESSPAATVYSGPAASTVGAAALLAGNESAVVMDVGGSTTDLSLILSGVPLAATNGLKIANYLTQIKGLALKSVAAGGDAPVEMRGTQPFLLEKRRGEAVCFGGAYPTLTDALNILDGVPGKNQGASLEAFINTFSLTESQVPPFAEETIAQAVNKIAEEIKKMIIEWQDEPAYRVWEVLQKEPLFPNTLVGIGGAAPGLTERVAKELGMKPYLPPFAGVANAIGCAVAKPSMSLKLHIDTGQKLLSLDNGLQKEYRGSGKEEDAIKLAKTFLVQRAHNLGIQIDQSDVEIVNSEIFSMIRGYYRAGYIIDTEVQIKPGLLTRVN